MRLLSVLYKFLLELDDVLCGSVNLAYGFRLQIYASQLDNINAFFYNEWCINDNILLKIITSLFQLNMFGLSIHVQHSIRF